MGYAHIFGAGGFSFATGYLQGLGGATSPVRQRVGAEFWYANPDVASRPTGNAARSLAGLQVLHSSVPDRTDILASRADLLLVPGLDGLVPAEDESGSAWGWGAGVELGLRFSVATRWNLLTSGTAMYQDIYARSTTNGAWTWHLGVSYGFGGGSGI